MNKNLKKLNKLKSIELSLASLESNEFDKKLLELSNIMKKKITTNSENLPELDNFKNEIITLIK